MRWVSSIYGSCDRYSNNIFDSVAQYEIVSKGGKAKYEALVGKVRLKKRFGSIEEAKDAVLRFIISECGKIIEDCRKEIKNENNA